MMPFDYTDKALLWFLLLIVTVGAYVTLALDVAYFTTPKRAGVFLGVALTLTFATAYYYKRLLTKKSVSLD